MKAATIHLLRRSPTPFRPVGLFSAFNGGVPLTHAIHYLKSSGLVEFVLLVRGASFHPSIKPSSCTATPDIQQRTVASWRCASSRRSISAVSSSSVMFPISPAAVRAAMCRCVAASSSRCCASHSRKLRIGERERETARVCVCQFIEH